jgi:hypothetical protein
VEGVSFAKLVNSVLHLKENLKIRIRPYGFGDPAEVLQRRMGEYQPSRTGSVSMQPFEDHHALWVIQSIFGKHVDEKVVLLPVLLARCRMQGLRCTVVLAVLGAFDDKIVPGQPRLFPLNYFNRRGCRV